jgi:hypothetical protein
VLLLDEGDMPEEVGCRGGGGQHRHAVTVTLFGPDNDLVAEKNSRADGSLCAWEYRAAGAVPNPTPAS